MTTSLLQAPVSARPENLTWFRVIVFEPDVVPGEIFTATVEACSAGEANELAIADAKKAHPNVPAWDIWYTSRVKI
jgi:hypothetical protein